MKHDSEINNKNYELIDLLVAACRTKHLNNRSGFNLYSRIKYIIKKLFTKRLTYKDKNKSTYLLPSHSNKIIPKEFIRVEPWELEYLFSVARFCKKGIVEIGRFNGGTSILFGAANSNVQIWSIDIAPQNDLKLAEILLNLKIKNINLITGDSQKTTYDKILTYDLLFIHGDHSYQGCYNDLNNWWYKLSPNGHLILHDCYLFSGVQQAVVDFLKDKKIEIILSPYMGTEHWHNRNSGSLCHVIKK